MPCPISCHLRVQVQHLQGGRNPRLGLAFQDRAWDEVPGFVLVDPRSVALTDMTSHTLISSLHPLA